MTVEAAVGASGRQPRRSRTAWVATAALVVSSAVLILLGSPEGQHEYVLGPFHTTQLQLLVALIAGIALSIVVWLINSRLLVQTRRHLGARIWVASTVIALVGIWGVALLGGYWIGVWSTVKRYTSVGEIDGREYLVLETTFGETSVSVYERHGPEVVWVASRGDSITEGTPFAAGDFHLEVSGSSATIEFTSRRGSNQRLHFFV